MKNHFAGAACAALALLVSQQVLASPKEANTVEKLDDGKVETAIELPGPPPPVVQDYEPAPAMWLLSDDDTKIYLFGTYHLLPENFRWRTPAFDQVVSEADELIVETSDEEAEQQLEDIIPTIFTQLGTRTPTSEKLSEANREKWESLAVLTGMPMVVFDRLPVLFAMMGVGLTITELAGSSGEYGVETILEAEFADAGKPIGSIESASDVMNALLALDEDLLIADLDKDLTKWDGVSMDTLFMEDSPAPDPEAEAAEDAAPVAFQTEHDWAQGIPVPVFDEASLENPIDKALFEALLVDRNRAWAEWLDTRLDSPGTILVAVGAGHFEGRGSVQEMLAERQLTVERVQ